MFGFMLKVVCSELFVNLLDHQIVS